MSSQTFPSQSTGNDGRNPGALQNLLVEELKDLYNAENQLVKALPKMAEAAHDPNLKQGLDQHLEQTKEHARRLEQAFQMLGQEVKGKTCKGIKGIVEEGEEEIKHGKEMPTFAADLALIAAAQKVEHYEISGYGSVRTMAEQIGKQDVATLLRQTEDEEKRADSLLTETARPILAMSA